jgi:hypothetical protein
MFISFDLGILSVALPDLFANLMHPQTGVGGGGFGGGLGGVGGGFGLQPGGDFTSGPGGFGGG